MRTFTILFLTLAGVLYSDLIFAQLELAEKDKDAGYIAGTYASGNDATHLGFNGGYLIKGFADFSLGISKTDFGLIPLSATTIAPAVSIIPIGYKEKLPFKIAVLFAYATTRFSKNRFGQSHDNTIIIGSSLFSKISIKRSIHFFPAAVVNHNANTSFYKGAGGESVLSYNFFSYGIFSAVRFDYSKSAYLFLIPSVTFVERLNGVFSLSAGIGLPR